MSIYEYNEEYVRKVLLEDGYAKGESDGYHKGLVHAVDANMENYHVDLESACKNLGISVEEYEKMKQNISGELSAAFVNGM